MYRFLLKAISLGWSKITDEGDADVVFLMYHRVTGDTSLELDLRYEHFYEQMSWLATQDCVVSLDNAVEYLQQNDEASTERKPRFVLTFDDAYRDFHTRAFPLLRDLDLPATLYVPTGFIDEPLRPPISRRIAHAERLQPITWAMLEELAASPLITLGSHTHTHAELPSLGDQALEEDLNRCDRLLEQRLGRPVDHFAYPRGVWDERVERIVRERYRTVALAGGGGVRRSNFDPCRLPRVPVLRSDEMRWFKPRIEGRLIYEEQMVRSIKSLLRRHGSGYS